MLIEVGELVNTELRFEDLSKGGVQSWELVDGQSYGLGKGGVGLRTYRGSGSRSQSRGLKSEGDGGGARSCRLVGLSHLRPPH